MCELHQHAKLEHWITPRDSAHLSAKMIHLFEGDEMPWHSTGENREEVIACIYGTIEIRLDDRIETVTSGEAFFIPAETYHTVRPVDGAAQYVYVCNKRKELTC